MPAKTFFSILIEAEQQDLDERNYFLRDLVTVARAGNTDGKGIESLGEYFYSRIDKTARRPASTAVPSASKVKWADGAKIMMSVFAQKKRAEGSRGRRY